MSIYRCFVFDYLFWNCQIPIRQKTKRQVNAFLYIASPHLGQHPKARLRLKDATKIGRIIEDCKLFARKI